MNTIKPTEQQFRLMGRYMQQADPTHAAELKAEHDDLCTQADLGRYYFECDPTGFWQSMEVAK